ncbi:phosphotransferase [Candidatus Poribacteria bacterium]|nr:phosphotransferase [Candidatus Poribacteria bacterium]MBT5531576.1 phosphotransferase [Candidatus Poribacteria bacterium]MBT5712262.1 phosphotransferase [Candidatus Poribacteria bacterium]MBT7099386.1 phosphotransferase [Candidatus Poribacteria bacterium]MBT7805913.1 phosphotransferase [Candidatus Poribacteria bacterium]
MSKEQRPVPSIEQIAVWLASRHDAEVRDLVPLTGGFWSSAYAYRVGADEFVLRLSDMSEGFAIDRAAMRFAGPNLPIPAVVDVGKALGLNYAISERHHGRFIETASTEEGGAVGSALSTLLAAMRAVPTTPSDRVNWHDPQASVGVDWRSWLSNGLVDNPDARVSGWRDKLAQDSHIDDVFKTAESRIHELLPACPERRDLVHGDLLHQNVLVSDDASQATAIFSWKCSALGDFLYDVAWCTFWSDWHPGIAAADIWNRTLAASDLTENDLLNASIRHHCYELQIGATHLGWHAWTGDQKELEAVAVALARTLEKGPLAMPQVDSGDSTFTPTR